MFQKSVSNQQLLRNVGIIAHIDAGKTTTVERMLFASGKIHKMGEVHHGDTVMDWMPQEQERGITISSAVTSFDWNNHRVSLIDTPGHVDFTIEVERSLRVLDGAVLILDGSQGVEPQTETVWRQCVKYGVPAVCFINKLDKVGSSLEESLSSLKKKLGINPVPLQIPLEKDGTFVGVIDVLNQIKLLWEEDKFEPMRVDLAVEEREKAQRNLQILEEFISEYDDDLLAKILNEEQISKDFLKKILRRECLNCRLVPVVCGSSLKNKGIQPLLDLITDYLPSPVERVHKGFLLLDGKVDKTISIELKEESKVVCFVFKILSDSFSGSFILVRIYSGVIKVGDVLWNPRLKKRERISKIYAVNASERLSVDSAKAGEIVGIIGPKDSVTGDTLCQLGYHLSLEPIASFETVISVVLEPQTSQDLDKLKLSLQKITREDPSSKFSIDQETGQILLSGMGELHLEILTERLRVEEGLNLRIGNPQVAFREKVCDSVRKEFILSRLINSQNHFAQITYRFFPGENNESIKVEFDQSINFSELPGGTRDWIQSGFEQVFLSGPILGYPLVGCSVWIEKVSADAQKVFDEQTVRTAVALSFREICQTANFELLEPYFELICDVPSISVGGVLSDINGRRGQVNSVEQLNIEGFSRLTAKVPLRELLGYATTFRSLTQGRGFFNMKFSDFFVVSPKEVEKIKNDLGR